MIARLELPRAARKRLSRWVPSSVKRALRRMRALVLRVVYYGRRRLCPICGATYRKFGPYGIVRREDALCYRCDSLERHRFAWSYFERCTDLFATAGKRVLHVAPEPCFVERFRRRFGSRYVTGDVGRARSPRVLLDVTAIPFAGGAFDVIYCSHVLEHVPDDRAAMRELHRVLKSDGWAILLVPITAPATFEDPAITDPAERLRLFGQDDHVRRYGPDYVERLRQAGFEVKITAVSDLFDVHEAERLGLTPAAGEIYFCTRARH